VRVLDELDGFVRALATAAGKTGAPLSLGRGARSLERAMLAASLPSATRETWAELVCVNDRQDPEESGHRRGAAAGKWRTEACSATISGPPKSEGPGQHP
jgi:hypothetical protein